MLVIKKAFDFLDFIELFSWELEEVSYSGKRLIYDAVCDIFHDGAHDESVISDYIKYQINVLSVDDFLNDYFYLFDESDLEDLESHQTIEAISNLISDYTNLIGTYEEDGTTYFIFEEF